jgi:cell division initiation protein
MKLTPLDIHHKEFRHSLRGYSEEEVDAFLDEVADEFERLFKENIDLSEKLQAANERLKEYADMERTVHNTMVAAQRSAEEIEATAEKDADVTRRDAELRAKEIIHAALAEKQKTQNEFMRLKQAETEFRQKFTAMLDEYTGGLSEIPAPREIEELGVVDIDAEAASAVASVTESVDEGVLGAPTAAKSASPTLEDAARDTEAEAVPETVEKSPAAAVASSAAAVAAEAAQDTPEPGFVTSVHLGEREGEEPSPEEPELVEPPEFDVPTFDSLGERDDDVDIVEID